MRWATAVIAAAALGEGCGPTCQSSCHHIYSPDECAVVTPGVPDWTEMYKDCVDTCQNALETPGTLGVYDPDVRNTSGESIKLENERQAAAWMDCIDQTSCERLTEGYCAPI